MEVRGFLTDKDESGYVQTYTGLAQTLRQDPTVCELGVYQGGSLALWQEMFPHAAVIVGVDIDPGATWPSGTVKIVADQQDPTLPHQLSTVLASEAFGRSTFDLIVDDASHQGHLTYKSLQHLWPLVAPGGFYVIEDWCVGFPMYQHYDDSMLSMAMMLLNFFDTPETNVHFLTYSYGMIIVRKKEEAAA
jgi:cephalosporin hydroxylase